MPKCLGPHDTVLWEALAQPVTPCTPPREGGTPFTPVLLMMV